MRSIAALDIKATTSHAAVRASKYKGLPYIFKSRKEIIIKNIYSSQFAQILVSIFNSTTVQIKTQVSNLTIALELSMERYQQEM